MDEISQSAEKMKDWYEGCTASREWRLNHLYYINTKNNGVMRFRLNWAQQRLHRNLWTRNTILKARQLGVSTYVAMLILDCCLFTPHFEAGIIDKTMADAEEKMRKIKNAYEWMLLPPPIVNDDHVSDEEDREMIRKYALTIARTGGNGLSQAAEVKIKKADFANGSKIRIGTNLRGGTMHLLHVSEFGYVSHKFPKKASDIITGALQTVHHDKVIIMESTHEGGKYGENYRMTREAMENEGKTLSKADYRFYFFPWWQQKEYELPDSQTDISELSDYWMELEAQGIRLSDAQKRWYFSMYRTLGVAVKREFPSTPDEAFLNQVEGAIYGQQISKLRAQGRVAAEFEPLPDLPFYVSWDIGMSDNMALWIVQPGGDGKYYFIDYYSANDMPLSHYVQRVQKWEAQFNMIVTAHLLPHDASHADFSKITFEQRLIDAGFRTRVLPRISDVWTGIFAARDVLAHSVFHERCNREINVDTRIYMSGIDALENYQKVGIGANGVERENPLHDACSHGADAFRYFAEAVMNGYIGRADVRRQNEDAERREKRRAPGTPAWW